MIRVDHVGVPARDKQAAADFLANVLGYPSAPSGGPFVAVPIGAGFTLDLYDAQEFEPMHIAFVADTEDFETILHRVRAAGLAYGNRPDDPANRRLDHPLSGRGLYFHTPDGHLLEVMAAAELGEAS